MSYFFISLFSSIIGAICGIGGGVIIKPVMDLFRLADVAAISFLSGCTVLSMSCYTVGRSLLSGEKQVRLSTVTPLALGAAVGGVAGKQLFSTILAASGVPDVVGAIQAGCLAAVTVGTLLYTLCKEKLHPRAVSAPLTCVLVGLALGAMSSFLGIGGGPINLVVLHFCFGMDTKTAAANSLYIIFFSQVASLVTTLLTHTVPAFSWPTLLLMMGGGIGGGMVGRGCNRRMDAKMVDRLFIGVMVLIIAISLYNLVTCVIGG